MAELADGTYIIHLAEYPHNALDCAGQQFTNGTNLIVWTTNNSDAQIWIVRTRSDGTRRIINRRSGKSMDVDGAQISTAGTNVQLWDDNNSAAQKWTIVDSGGSITYNGTSYSTYYLKLSSGFVAMATGSAALSNVQIDSQGSSTRYVWFFEPVPLLRDGGIYELRTALNKKMGLEVVGGMANGGNVQLNYANDRNTMKFVLTQETAGKWSLYNTETGKYVDVASGSEPNGRNVQQWDDSDTRSQRWNVVSYGTGTVEGITCFACRLGSYITNDGTAYKMDVSKSDSSAGNNVQLWENNNNDAQLWYLLPTTAEDVTMPVPYSLGISTSKGAIGRPWIETTANGAYLFWKCSKAWQADGSNHYELRWRTRKMRSRTSSWRTWSSWTAWTTPAVHRSGDCVWTADPLDVLISYSSDKSMEIEFQVRGVGSDEYESLHSKAAGTTVHVYKQPTVSITDTTFSPEGLRIAFTTDYVYGTTYVTINRIRDALTGKLILNRPVRLELQTAADSALIDTSDLMNVPEDGHTYRYEYKVGYDQNTLFNTTYTSDQQLDFNGGNYDFEITLIEDGLRLYATVPGLAVTRCWVSDGDNLVECPVTTDYYQNWRTIFDIPYAMGKESTIYVSTHSVDGSRFGTASVTWSNNVIAHGFTTEDGHSMFLHKFVGAMPTMNRTRSSVYEADVLDARIRESISFNGTVKSTITAYGDLLKPEDYSTIEDFEALEGKHAVFRDLYGDIWQVAVTSVDYVRNEKYDRVTVSMIEETL